MPRKAESKSKSPRLPLREDILRPTFRRERRAINRGLWPVAGCDEAGRGPLAGPVVAAAVVLDPKRIPRGRADGNGDLGGGADFCVKLLALFVIELLGIV